MTDLWTNVKNELMKKLIKITCQGSEIVDYLNLHEFQDDLKDLSEKGLDRLERSILKYGYRIPMFVWKNKGRYNILDGHQRKRVISHLVEKKGYACPELPVINIPAESMKEAKELLLMILSEFGDKNRQGLYEFLEANKFKIKDVMADYKFADIDLPGFNAEFYVDLDKKNEERGETSGGDKVTKEVTFTEPIVHKCPKCSAKFTCTPVKKS